MIALYKLKFLWIKWKSTSIVVEITCMSMKNVFIYLNLAVHTSSYSFWRTGIFLGEIIERCIPLWKWTPHKTLSMAKTKLIDILVVLYCHKSYWKLRLCLMILIVKMLHNKFIHVHVHILNVQTLAIMLANWSAMYPT